MLSIVVQGALFQGNMIETANHCRHWRELFPNAQIILVVSLSDVVFGTLQNGIFTNLRLVAKHRHDGHLAAALETIFANCDLVGMGESALPLPPIKSDTPKLNNMNLQLAAARHGLSLVTSKYVLRIRSDLVFLDRSFIQQYEDGIVLPRGNAAVFYQRVLISWLYTLNPFTVERMPLHFSDWFHFGLAKDVRSIWVAPPLTLRDSLYYRSYPHNLSSNPQERLFNIRLAVEQHIAFHCFKPHIPELTLDYHNDHTSINLSMDILIDNFVVCDLVRAHCIFNKYIQEFFDDSKRLQCITAESWLSMTRNRPADYRTLSEDDWIAMSRAPKAETAEPEESTQAESEEAFQLSRNFPRVFSAGRLRTKIGRVVDGTIVADHTDGVLVHGPYVTLEAGRYVAIVSTAILQGPGLVVLKVTGNGGRTTLARRKFRVGAVTVPKLQLAFDILADMVDFEVVCTVKGFRTAAVSAVTIEKRTDSDDGFKSWLPSWLHRARATTR